MVTKVCTKCGVELPANKDYFHEHKRGKFGLVANCRGCCKKYGKNRREVHPNIVRNAVLKYMSKLKSSVISHYGGKCATCGESRLPFLTIDHINGGGSKHRKDYNFKSSTKFYVWLRNTKPDGFQVLCWNCNWLKYVNEIPVSGSRKKLTKRRHYNNLRTDVLLKYGGKCKCCGETNMSVLTIDHVNNDGSLDRRVNCLIGGHAIYKLLRDIPI